MFHPADNLLEQLTQWMGTLPPHDKLFLPLAAGHHVDHQLTRLAAERCFGVHAAVCYYEDYPYVRHEQALTAALEADGDANLWKPLVVPLSEAALEAKVAAVLSYESQLSSFFNGPLDVEVQIKGYARRMAEAVSDKPEKPDSTSSALGDWRTERLDTAFPGGAERVWQRGNQPSEPRRRRRKSIHSNFI